MFDVFVLVLAAVLVPRLRWQHFATMALVSVPVAFLRLHDGTHAALLLGRTQPVPGDPAQLALSAIITFALWSTTFCLARFVVRLCRRNAKPDQ